MGFIGKIIKQYRTKIGMSRKVLAENICSEKYVYLIEAGKRTPSSHLTEIFGDKLGVDLFKYYEYFECISPIEVNDTIVLFQRYRRTNDMEALKEITQEAMVLPDFKNKPWVYEIELNSFLYMVLLEERYNEAIDKIKNVIVNIEQIYSHEGFVASLYILLSCCYQMVKDSDNSQKAILLAQDKLKNKQGILKYTQIIIAFKINKITLHYQLDELDEIIEEGLELNKYQNDNGTCEYAYHTFAFLAFAYYQKGFEDEGVAWFLKALYTLLVEYKPLDVHYLLGYPLFNVLMEEPRLSRDLINQFKKKYKAAF